jgi:hypothetical protein
VNDRSHGVFARRAAFAAMAVAAVVAYFASRNVLIAEMRGLRPSWSAELLRSGVAWALFGLLGAPLVALARRVAAPWSRPRAMVTIAALVLGASLLHALLQGLLGGAPVPAPGGTPRQVLAMLPRAYTSMVLFAFLLIAEWGWRRYRALEQQRREVARLADEVARERVAGLRHQLQPRLMFEALRDARRRLPADPAAAERLLSRLAALLRWVLDARQERVVELREEIELVTRYLDVERVRFGSRLAVRLDVAPEVATFELPAMLLQPLVETLVHDSASRGAAPGIVTFAARARPPGLEVELGRHGDTAPSADDEAIDRQLALLAERLAQAYGGAATATLDYRGLDGVRLRLRLPALPLPAWEPPERPAAAPAPPQP